MADDPTTDPISFPMQLELREDGSAQVRPMVSPAELEGRRMLALLPNGLVRLTVDGRHRWRRDGTVVLNVARHSVERLREVSKHSDPIDVPDVGRVRMCALPEFS